MTCRGSVLLALPRETGRLGRPDVMIALLSRIRDMGLQVQDIPFDGSMTDSDLASTIRREAEKLVGEGPLVIGGFSRGARMAASIAAESGAKALLLAGYPFHEYGEPQRQHGLKLLHLQSLPVLILQGTRDPYGSRQELRSYSPLPSRIQVHFLEDGNHHLLPRSKSGVTKEDNTASTLEASEEFLNEWVGGPCLPAALLEC